MKVLVLLSLFVVCINAESCVFVGETGPEGPPGPPGASALGAAYTPEVTGLSNWDVSEPQKDILYTVSGSVVTMMGETSMVSTTNDQAFAKMTLPQGFNFTGHLQGQGFPDPLTILPHSDTEIAFRVDPGTTTPRLFRFVVWYSTQ